MLEVGPGLRLAIEVFMRCWLKSCSKSSSSAHVKKYGLVLPLIQSRVKLIPSSFNERSTDVEISRLQIETKAQETFFSQTENEKESSAVALLPDFSPVKRHRYVLFCLTFLFLSLCRRFRLRLILSLPSFIIFCLSINVSFRLSLLLFLSFILFDSFS